MKEYKVFISHSWDYSDDLERLKILLDNRGYFYYESKESSRNTPINSDNADYIKAVLRSRIKESNIMLALAGIYASHSEWMKWEIETARRNGIPIVGIIPRGRERISKIVYENSIDDIHWNTESIVNAIRKYSK